MRRIVLVGPLAVLLLAGCLVAQGRRGSSVVLVPALPPVVVLEAEPYYQHSGYVYHYRNDRWFYSRSRSGTWLELPRDRYPKEVKFKDKDKGDELGQGEKRGHDDSDDERGKGEKRGHDKQDRD
jgi:hypothetical protein